MVRQRRRMAAGPCLEQAAPIIIAFLAGGDAIIDIRAWLRGIGLGPYDASFRESKTDAIYC
jgi:hypothetical protein